MRDPSRARGIRGWSSTLAAAIALCGDWSRAQQELTPLIDNLPAGTAGVGGALRVTRSPHAGDDDIDFVPLYLYEGRRFFFHGTSLGVHVASERALELDFVARYRFWSVKPKAGTVLEDLDERRQSIDAGLAVRWSRGAGQFGLEWLTDILDRHGGQELEASYRYTLRHDRWVLSPFVALTLLDSRMSDYYFGVRDHERRDGRDRYSPGRVNNLRYGLNTTYHLGDSFQVFANIGVTELDERLYRSPIVEETLRPNLLVGTSYFFGSVFAPRPRVREERRAEWSFRINFGYQAQGNIVGDIDQGDFRRSVDADTKIAGFTLSKLLDEGRRFDFVGRLAVFRHLEGEDHKDFFSLAAYVAALGKGYFPWSDEPAFRWGFGIGLSYAQKVPLVERVKQERRNRNKTRFLNYLEMTIDFPLRRVAPGSFLRRCFAGLTTVHRSGIFSTSDLLGDVAGGSDWLTAHLECVR